MKFNERINELLSEQKVNYKEIATDLEGEENDMLTLEFADGSNKSIRVGYIPNLQDKIDVKYFIDSVEDMYGIKMTEWDEKSGVIVFK
jgi:hypothetical protein